MDNQTKNRILRSIESDRLVVLCGAGLSIAAPSNVPPAWKVAEECHDRHCEAVDPEFNPEIRHDLEAIAEHFAACQELDSYFINSLVPWSRFFTSPNLGHLALADFLLCRAVHSVLSTNYDELIETPAKYHGTDLQVSLNGDEANIHSNFHSPLLKFHGCATDRKHTVWTKSQLTSDHEISRRISSITGWMTSNLREKDLLIIGFWSDWSYLNEIIESTFENVSPHSVTIIDPCETGALEEKAPRLWEIANSEGVFFEHVRESGSDILDYIRCEFSKSYMRKIFGMGKNAFEHESGRSVDPAWLEQPPLTSEDLYTWRKDAEGLGGNDIPRRKTPYEDEVLGHFHLLLRDNGAEVSGSRYTMANQKLRVVRGAGQYLHTIKQNFQKPPAADDDDVIVCVGSRENSLPDNIIRSGSRGGIVRPAPMSQFVTDEEAREMLGI